MFEVPAAKRVKRSELFEDNTSDLHESIRADRDGGNSSDGNSIDVTPSYGFEYDFIDRQKQQQQPQSIKPLDENQALNEPGQPQDEAEDEAEAEAEAGTFQFNLFRSTTTPKPSRSQDDDNDKAPSAATATTTAPQSTPKPGPVLISLRSPSPLNAADPSLAFRQHRPDSYYFTVTASTPPNALKAFRASYAECAVSSATIHQQLVRAWPGTYLPWRVVQLPAHARQVVVHGTGSRSDGTISGGSAGKSSGEMIGGARRARPSKKRREVRKEKARQRQRVVDESKTKEEHEREKRNKKNRERKLKRRAKERKEKEKGRVGTGIGEGGGSKDEERSEVSSRSDLMVQPDDPDILILSYLVLNFDF